MATRTKRPAMSRVAEPYLHTQETPMRPEVGTQAQFKKRKAPKTYRYDSSLDPGPELGRWGFTDDWGVVAGADCGSIEAPQPASFF